MKGLMWFREDLRTHDNQALNAAIKYCKNGIVAVYVIDVSFWKKHHIAPCRVQFMLAGLLELSVNLRKKQIPLLIRKIKHTRDTKKTLLQIMRRYHLKNLFFNKLYEIDEKRRDMAITHALKKQQINCYSFDDQFILPPDLIRTKTDTFFKKFTAFKREWVRQFKLNQKVLTPQFPRLKNKINLRSNPIPSRLKGFYSLIKWPAGETFASKKLQRFIKNKLFQYHLTRDYPAMNGTSELSPYLSAGMLSPRKCFFAALKANHGKINNGNSGALMWMNELIWRDFYKYLLRSMPRLSMAQPFQLKTEKLPWRYNKKQMLAWQQGKTGFPIIDAAMRQLNQTGWMHNRLRMIVASFLAKNLLFDWRLGEDYFIRHLIDGDLAANNGGWQWCAGTGVDAAPYFRVFNPIRQSKRFDPEGKFILQYCPELKGLNKRNIHNPYQDAPKFAKQSKYPKPIVDLDISAKNFIHTFKNL